MPVTPDAGPHLRAAGHDAIHAVDLGLARSSDDELLTVARREERVIITADLDYPRLIALQQADRPGIILFRGGAYSDREMLALLDRVLTRAPPHSASNTQSLSSIASASVAAPCLSASNRQCQSAGQSVVSTTRRTAAASTRRRNLTTSAPEGTSASAQVRSSSMQRIRFDNRALPYSASFRAT